MGSVSVELSEVRAFARELEDAPLKVVREIIPVMRKGAVNIKSDMQADLRGSSNAGFQYVASTVSYDVLDGGFGVEVGPSKPSGALANVAYFGTSRGGGTVADPVGALQAEIPRFEKAIDDILGGML